MFPRKKPVFFDPHGHRARLLNVVLALAGVFATAAVTVITIGVLIAPDMSPPPGRTAPLSEAGESSRATGTPNEPPIASGQIHNPAPASAGAFRLAFFSYDDEASLQSLKLHTGDVDGLILNWIHLDDATSEALNFPSGDPEMLNSLARVRSLVPKAKLYPSLTLFPERMSLLLDPATREGLAASVAANVEANDFAGVVVGIRSVPPSAQPVLIRTIASLRRTLSSDGRSLILSVPEEVSTESLAQLVPFADFVLIRTENESVMRDTTGPAVSQGWFEGQLLKRLRVVPQEKLIVTIGSYGLDFDASARTRRSPSSAHGISSANPAPS
ncbi:hypothetical protein A7A08_01766 [Methyloligella halotolerans]|uniref:Uncharacterized protein n=1 Tax=Methyloligella halotolerans TaxID=1177755 RepID=A0A1E2RZZ3_9HYPH|nr:hypothetical protein [Methyloligella halotolerans]ODA67730.1 hypothetical protein A7A08_01766 [Methyloligella halotolerans]